MEQEHGRRCLVTGGTGGIGRAIVARLVERGWAVAFSGRDVRRGGALAAETGATFVRHDATGDPRALVAAAAASLGGLDALVLNAGVLALADLAGTDAATWARTVTTNAAAPIREIGAALPVLARGDEPAIVGVASNAGLWGETGIAAYSVSKAALLAAIRATAAAAGTHGVRASAVCPGDTEPGMAALGVSEPGEPVDPFTILPPLGRLGRGRDTAEAVAWLASPASGFVNGAALLVDGGMHAALDTAVAR